MAQQVVELTSDEAKLLAGMQRVLAKQVEMQTKWMQTGTAAKKAGDAGKTAGDDSAKGMQKMLPSLQSYVAGWITAAGVITAATRALKEHADEKKKALTSAERLDESNRNLASVAGPGELAGMIKRADTISKSYGVDRAVSRDFLFSARSEGFEDYVEDAAKFSGVMKLDTQAIAAGQTRTLFGKKITAREAVVMAGAAAEQSRLKSDEFLKALPAGAAGGAAAGASPEETMALVSVLASNFSSGDTASQRVGSLGVKLGLDERFKGRGIVDAVKRMQADPELRTDFAGESKELNEAIDAIIAQMPTITDRAAMLGDERGKAGTKNDWLEMKYRERMGGDKDFANLQTLHKARNEREIAREDVYAEEQAQRETTQELQWKDMEQRGLSAGGRFGAARGANIADALGLGTKNTELAMRWGQGIGSAFQLDFSGMREGALGTSQFIAEGALAPAAKRLGFDEEHVDRTIAETNKSFGGSRVGLTEDLLKQIAQNTGATAKGNGNAPANAQAGRHIE